MAQNMFNYFSFISLAMAALLLLCQSTVAENPSPINKFCKTADHKQLCTKMVNGGKNLHEASKNAMQYTFSAAKELQPMMNLIKPAITSLQKPKVSRDSIFSICKEDLESKVDDLQGSLEAWDQNDKGTVLANLGAAYNSDCSMAFEDMGAKPPPVLSRHLDNFAKLVDNCLDVVQQK